MSDKDRPKLVIRIEGLHVEGDLATLPAGDFIFEGLFSRLKAMRDDLNSKGIDTTITIAGVEVGAGAEDDRPSD